jgi:SH3-like domain-containing protein
MSRKFTLLSALAFSLLSFSAAQAAVNNVNNSGLPIPRFVALKAEETNTRTGPGTRYPIQWVYHREGLPVEVVEEFEHWRKIRDMEGTTGWVHKTMVVGGRNVLIKAKDARIIRAEPAAKGRPLLKVEPQVIAKLAECEKDWCRIQVTGRKGWIEKKYLFGVYPDEVFD